MQITPIKTWFMLDISIVTMECTSSMLVLYWQKNAEDSDDWPSGFWRLFPPTLIGQTHMIVGKKTSHCNIVIFTFWFYMTCILLLCALLDLYIYMCVCFKSKYTELDQEVGTWGTCIFKCYLLYTIQCHDARRSNLIPAPSAVKSEPLRNW